MDNDHSSAQDGSGNEAQFKKCPACSALGYAGDLYCARCGKAFKPLCPQCGALIIHPVAIYCTRCGLRLNGERTET